MHKSSTKLEKCQPSTSSSSSVSIPAFCTNNGRILQKIIEHKQLDFNLTRHEKLVKLSKKASCQVSVCQCKGWHGNQDNISMSSTCIKLDCNHSLSSHVTHLEDAEDEQLNILLRLVFDLDNISVTISSELKKPRIERNYVLEKTYNSIYHELKQFVYPGSQITLEKLYGTPPFENPNIVKALMNFNMYKFGHDISQLKIALKLSTFLLRHFDQWNWTLPKELLFCKTLLQRRNYEFYYQRYLVFCRIPKYLQSVGPCFKMTMIFGQDVLKYILKIFRMYLTDWCHETFSKNSGQRQHFYMNYLPKYMNFLEAEVYAIHSPIWDLHFKDSDFKKILLSGNTVNLLNNHVILKYKC